MEIKRIAGKECRNTRFLWEEVFSEDSQQFTDYYFEYKAENNIGYVLGEKPYDAMMFRAPYLLQIGKKQKEISYLVGVATRKECRHKGHMTALLMYSLEEMYQEKQPFTFLMPANPAIYEPFGFRYIYERDVWTFVENGKQILSVEKKESGNGLYSVTSLLKQKKDSNILQQLADFSNEYLRKHYQIYVVRDADYYETQLKESQAQNGDIYVWLKQGKITGFFLYAKEEGEVFIQEVMEAKQGTFPFLKKEEKKKPVIMARIIHLEEMLKLLVSDSPKTVLLEVEDDLLPQNDGVYRLEMTSEGSLVTKLKEARTPDVFFSVTELAEKILKNVCLNEIV